MSLREVFKRIEAFKENMEKLGVRVNVTVEEVPVVGGPKAVINLKTWVREELDDLEASG